MEIRKIDIAFVEFRPLTTCFPDKKTDIKSLPYLSIVQSKVGCYEIKMDDSPTYFTGEGGFFIAPSGSRQTIVHHVSESVGEMYARWLFLDARVNDKYTLDELFSFPIVIDAVAGRKLDECFDALESTDDYCEKMSIVYRIIGQLIAASESERSPDSDGVANAVKYMHRNYSKKISVSSLAKIANMSESGLYASFRRKYSASPLDYLNHLRLSVASEMLSATSASVETVAAAVGIQDQFYFSKLFKRTFGFSPSEYRKINRVER